MGATAFFTLDRRLGSRIGNLIQVIQLQRFDTGSVECLAGIGQLGLANTLADFFQQLQTLLHALAVTEYAEVQLHAVLQILANLGHVFTFGSSVQTIEARHGTLDDFFGSDIDLKAAAQLLFDVPASRTTEYNQVQQGVTTQTVGTVHRHTSSLTTGKQARDRLVVAVFVLGQGLATYVGGNTGHPIVTGRDHRNRLFNRVNVREGTGQLTDTRQTQVQGFFTQVIQLQQYVILVRATTAAFQDRSEEHTSELQSRPHLVCRLLLEKKKNEHGASCHPEHPAVVPHLRCRHPAVRFIGAPASRDRERAAPDPIARRLDAAVQDVHAED